MPRTKNVPRRSEGGAAREQQRAAAPATALALVLVPHPNASSQVFGAVASAGVTVKEEEEEEEEEETPEGQQRYLPALTPGPTRDSPIRPREALGAAPAPAPRHDAPLAAAGAGVSGVTQVKEEEAEETLGQLRDRQALALAHGPVRVDSHIKVEDTDGEDTDGGQDGVEEVGPGGEGGDGEEDGLGGEGGLVLLTGAAHMPGDDGGHGGAPHRSTAAERAARAKRGRGDITAGDVPDAPAPKRKSGGARVGPSGRYGVYNIENMHISKDTPWLKWRNCTCLARQPTLSTTLPMWTTPPGLTTRKFGGAGGCT